MKFTDYNLTEIIELLKQGKVTSKQLVEECIENIKKYEDHNYLISTCFDEALKNAEEVDNLRAKGEILPDLAGVPYIAKDNMNVIGTKTTCASKFLENYESVYDATVIKNLKESKAILIGKANMDEFAMGSSNENSAYGIPKNPVNPLYVTGGSSGGSAGSVVKKLAYFSLGTDTGGSIRQPSSLCGAFGLKTTYGLVSRYGVVAFGSGFDQVGPIARSAKDLAYVLNSIASYDEKEITSSKLERPDYLKSFTNSVKGKRIGVDKKFFAMGMEDDVKNSVENVIQFFKDNGAEIVDIDLTNISYVIPVYYILSSAEASSNLGRFDGIRYGVRANDKEDLFNLYTKSRSQGFGKEVKRRIMMGNFVLASGYFDAYYKKAQKVQEMLKQDFANAFEKCDVIISPTSPTVAFKIGEKIDDPVKMYLSDIFTVPINLVGIPAISFPCGKNKDGLPIGCQLMAKHFNEPVLLDMADFYEKNAKEEN